MAARAAPGGRSGGTEHLAREGLRGRTATRRVGAGAGGDREGQELWPWIWAGEGTVQASFWGQ